MQYKRLFLLVLIVILAAGIYPASAQDSGNVKRISVPGLMAQVRLSPDGRTLAVFENSNMHENYEVDPAYLPIRLIDIETGEQRELSGETDYALDVAFSPDSSTLASYHGSGWIALWDVTSGAEIKRIPAIVGLNRLLFMPDGKTLAVLPSSVPLLTLLWDTESGAITTILGRRFATYAEFSTQMNQTGAGSIMFDRPSTFAVTPDGSGIIIANIVDTITYWDVASGESRSLVESEEEAPALNIRQLFVMADGKTLAYFHHQGKMLHFIDLATGTESSLLAVNTKVDPAVSPDGQKIIWLDADTGNLVVWSAAQPDNPVTVALPDPERVLNDLHSPISSVILTPDGRTAIIGGFDGMDTGQSEIWIVPLPE